MVLAYSRVVPIVSSSAVHAHCIQSIFVSCELEFQSVTDEFCEFLTLGVEPVEMDDQKEGRVGDCRALPFKVFEQHGVQRGVVTPNVQRHAPEMFVGSILPL